MERPRVRPSVASPFPGLLALVPLLAGDGLAPGGTGWVAAFDDGDVPFAIDVAPSGEVSVAGYTLSAGAGWFDVWVARLAPGGATRWEQALGGPGWDEAHDVIATADGGMLVVGFTDSFGAGGRDGWIVKLDARGAVEWQRTYGSALDEQLTAVDVSPDGYYVGGWIADPVTELDAWVLEIDPLGNVLWQEALVGSGPDQLKDLSATPDGLIVTSDSKSAFAPTPQIPEPPFFRPWLVKLDGDGAVQWQRTYDYSGGDAWNEIVPLDDGGYVVVGEIFSMAFYRGDVWVVRLGADGDVVWDRRIGDNFGVNWVDYGVGVRPTADGGFAVAASTGTAGAGDEDLWVLRLDSAGTLLWDRTYGASTFDYATDLGVAPDGDLLVAGFLMNQAGVLRLRPDGGTACNLSSPTAPNVWTDALTIVPVLQPPFPTSIVPAPSAATVTPLQSSVFLCPPLQTAPPDLLRSR